MCAIHGAAAAGTLLSLYRLLLPLQHGQRTEAVGVAHHARARPLALVGSLLLFAERVLTARAVPSVHLAIITSPTTVTISSSPARRPLVIDTLHAAGRACAALRGHRILAMDLEGAPLETRISLLQIAILVAPPPNIEPEEEEDAAGGHTAATSGTGRVAPYHVYLFDVLALGQVLFDASHLRPILSDPAVLKLCYDCRGMLLPRWIES